MDLNAPMGPPSPWKALQAISTTRNVLRAPSCFASPACADGARCLSWGLDARRQSQILPIHGLLVTGKSYPQGLAQESLPTQS